MNIKLKKYTEEYYNFVYEVKKNAYKKYVEECWGVWNEADQRKHYDNFIRACKDNLYIIQLDEENIGFYNAEELQDGTYEIGNICIISKHQRKGIGTLILQDLIEKHKGKSIKLQYFKQNPVGKLYERLGFKRSGETEYHYQMQFSE